MYFLRIYLCIYWGHPKDQHINPETEKTSFPLVHISVILGKTQDNNIKILSRSEFMFFLIQHICDTIWAKLVLEND